MRIAGRERGWRVREEKRTREVVFEAGRGREGGREGGREDGGREGGRGERWREAGSVG